VFGQKINRMPNLFVGEHCTLRIYSHFVLAKISQNKFRVQLLFVLVGFLHGDYVRDNMSTVIYKICSRAEWHTARQSGAYAGSPDDARDGFIHFSTAPQLKGTLAKHFAGQADLVLVAVDAAVLGADLKWGKSRGGDLFPHLYRSLATSEAKNVADLPLVGDKHVLPELETR